MKWPADSVSYTLRISLRTAPDSAYTVYDVADLNTALTGPDGTNDWFNTAVEIMPASGYSIVRSDNISTGVPTFLQVLSMVRCRMQKHRIKGLVIE